MQFSLMMLNQPKNRLISSKENERLRFVGNFGFNQARKAFFIECETFAMVNASSGCSIWAECKSSQMVGCPNALKYLASFCWY